MMKYRLLEMTMSIPRTLTYPDTFLCSNKKW